jgi:hypothetical protein
MAYVKGSVIQFLLDQQRTATGALIGGKVYFYNPGTTSTTGINIWLDEAASSAANNPYTLDANGTAQLYASGKYRIVIKNAAGVTQFDRDNVMFYDFEVPYFVDALQYGAGTFTQATIAAALTAIGSNPATLLLRPGTWVITSDLTISANVSLEMAKGAIFSVTAGKFITLSQPFDALWFGSAYTGATITLALAAIGTTNKVALILNPGTWVITADSLWGDYTNVTWKFVPGAVLDVTPGKYVELGGPLADMESLNQRFTNDSNIYFRGSSVRYVMPQWWGAKGDGATDDTDALYNCFNSCRGALYGHTVNPVSTIEDGCAKIVIPRGSYLRSTNKRLPVWDGVTLEGEVPSAGGLQVTTIVDGYTSGGVYPTDLIVVVPANFNAAGTICNDGSGGSATIKNIALIDSALVYGDPDADGVLLRFMTNAEASTYTGGTITGGSFGDATCDKVWFQGFSGVACSVSGSVHFNYCFFDVGMIGIQANVAAVIRCNNTTFYECRRGAIIYEAGAAGQINIDAQCCFYICGSIYGDADHHQHNIFYHATDADTLQVGQVTVKDSYFYGGQDYWDTSNKISGGSSIKTDNCPVVMIQNNLMDDIGEVELAGAIVGMGRVLNIIDSVFVDISNNIIISRDLTHYWLHQAEHTDGVYTDSRMIKIVLDAVSEYNYNITGNVMVNQSDTAITSAVYSDQTIAENTIIENNNTHGITTPYFERVKWPYYCECAVTFSLATMPNRFRQKDFCLTNRGGDGTTGVVTTLPTPSEGMSAQIVACITSTGIWRFVCTGLIMIEGEHALHDYVELSTVTAMNAFRLASVRYGTSWVWMASPGVTGTLTAG